jgi:hypothetical protein
MNTETGALRRMNIKDEQDRLNAALEGLTPVPKKYAKSADELLGDSDSVIVDMTQDTPLVSWAKQHQAKKNNRKAMQKSSKRRNRK